MCKQTTETKHPLQEKVNNADDGLKLFFTMLTVCLKEITCATMLLLEGNFSAFFFRTKKIRWSNPA